MQPAQTRCKRVNSFHLCFGSNTVYGVKARKRCINLFSPADWDRDGKLACRLSLYAAWPKTLAFGIINRTHIKKATDV